jgi:enoyl-CoA hydratase/carnithine racemase
VVADAAGGNVAGAGLMFLSERIDARRCEMLGLVNRVVPDDRTSRTAFALAKSLAEGPSIALARMKDNLDHAVASDFLDSMDQEAGKHGPIRTDDRS